MNTTPHSPAILRKIEELQAQGYVTSKELYEADKKLRRMYSITPRANFASFQGFLWLNRHKIRREKINPKLNMYHEDDALDAMTDQYASELNGTHSRAHTNHSMQNSHLEATPAILANPNYQPREFLTTFCHISPNRIHKLVEYKVIIPYWDTARKRLLYPVDKTIDRACHHPLKTIRKHLGAAYAEHIKATRPSLQWAFGDTTRTIYYCPECPSL